MYNAGMNEELNRPNWIVWVMAPLIATTFAYFGAYVGTVDPPGPFLVGGIPSYPSKLPVTYSSEWRPLDQWLRKHEDVSRQLFAPIHWVDCKARHAVWYVDGP
jgi:hypothetical protein